MDWTFPAVPAEAVGLHLAAVELRFPPDAPPGATLHIVTTETGPGGTVVSRVLVLAADEFGERGPLLLELMTRWAEDCLRAKGYLGDGAVRAAPAPPPKPVPAPAPGPGLGRLG